MRLGEATLALLREDHAAVGDDVELALRAGDDLGHVLGLGVELGRETRGPSVVPRSDGAVVDLDLHAAENATAPAEDSRRHRDQRFEWPLHN